MRRVISNLEKNEEVVELKDIVENKVYLLIEKSSKAKSIVFFNQQSKNYQLLQLKNYYLYYCPSCFEGKTVYELIEKILKGNRINVFEFDSLLEAIQFNGN